MLERLKATGQTIKREIKVYQRVLRDSRTPLPAKLLLGWRLAIFSCRLISFQI
jgi:hypothetical protein